MSPRRPRSEAGFTLLELLVVMVVIGLLAAIAVPTFLSQKRKAGDTALRSDLRALVLAQETYFSNNGVYATSAAQLNADQPGIKGSPGTLMTVVPGPTSTEYCVAGFSTKGTPDPLSPAQSLRPSYTYRVYYYDSTVGAMRIGAGTTICGATDFPQQLWDANGYEPTLP